MLFGVAIPSKVPNLGRVSLIRFIEIDPQSLGDLEGLIYLSVFGICFINNDGQQNHETLDHLLPKRGNVQQD